MNVLEVQDALKDFSQNNYGKEMQMPSGQAPQFLVLSELNRRQRRRDFEARQAQQQPTVAEKLVAPQSTAGRHRRYGSAMAPQTDMATRLVLLKCKANERRIWVCLVAARHYTAMQQLERWQDSRVKLFSSYRQN